MAKCDYMQSFSVYVQIPYYLGDSFLLQLYVNIEKN